MVEGGKEGHCLVDASNGPDKTCAPSPAGCALMGTQLRGTGETLGIKLAFVSQATEDDEWASHSL